MLKDMVFIIIMLRQYGTFSIRGTDNPTFSLKGKKERQKLG